MDYDKIKLAALHVYRKCNICRFPINCFDILTHYGLTAKKYEDLPPKKKAACLELSSDSCAIGSTIYYNSQMLEHRIRFSLMHELGHILLFTNLEEEANFFASYILAPRIAIKYTECKNETDVAKIFNLSNEASKYAFDDYRRWRRHITSHKVSTIDKLTYYHFYDTENKLFVWNKSACRGCGNTVYNTLDSVCDKCNHTSNQIKVMEKISIIRSMYKEPEIDDDFRKAEHYWLYGDCY